MVRGIVKVMKEGDDDEFLIRFSVQPEVFLINHLMRRSLLIAIKLLGRRAALLIANPARSLRGVGLEFD